MAALNRTVTLAEVACFAALVANHLNFDVARLFNELLHVHAIVAEGSRSFLAGRLPRFFELIFLPNGTHALTAASGRSLHHDGVTNFFGGFLRVGQIFQQAFRTRYARNACRLHGLLGRGLVPHFVDLVGGSPDELDPVLRTDA